VPRAVREPVHDHTRPLILQRSKEANRRLVAIQRNLSFVVRDGQKRQHRRGNTDFLQQAQGLFTVWQRERRDVV
jgi:hypothetical protein